MENQTVTVDELANMLNLTPRRVQQLANEGALLRGEHGRYLLSESVRCYISSLEARRDPVIQELNAKKGRLLDMELAKRDGRLIDLEEATHTVEELTGSFISMLDGLPAQIALETVGRTNMQKFTEYRCKIESVIDANRQRIAVRFTEIAAEMKKSRS